MIKNDYSDWYAELLTQTTIIESFDCEDEDLNDFLFNDDMNAIKIGRLAVSKQYQKAGFGNLIIRIVRGMYTSMPQQAGCRFITVDAYKNALLFYEKNGFKFLTDKDKANDTRAMYYDLKAIT